MAILHQKIQKSTSINNQLAKTKYQEKLSMKIPTGLIYPSNKLAADIYLPVIDLSWEPQFTTLKREIPSHD